MKMMIGVSVAADVAADEPADQCTDQAGGLGQADTDHHDEDDGHGGEVAEVRDERREHEAHAVDRDEALDLCRLRHDLVLALLHRRIREAAGRLRRAALDDLLDGDRRRLVDLVGHVDVGPREHGREQDHADAEVHEQESPGSASCCRRARSPPRMRSIVPRFCSAGPVAGAGSLGLLMPLPHPRTPRRRDRRTRPRRSRPSRTRR